MYELADAPFNPLAPWPGDLDLACNLITNHGGIETGCVGDWTFDKTSAGDVVYTVVAGEHYAFGNGVGSINFRPGNLISYSNLLDFTGLSTGNRHLIRVPDTHTLQFTSDAATPSPINITIMDGANSRIAAGLLSLEISVPTGNGTIFTNAGGTTDTVRIIPGTVGGTSSQIDSTGGDLRIEVPTGQFVDIGPRWKSSDALTYSSPFEFAQMNGTVAAITGTWNSAVMRADVTQTATTGGQTFGSQIKGLIFLNKADGTALSGNATFGAIGGIDGIAYWNGGSRSVLNCLGLNGQCGTNNTGTVTNAYAVNGQALTIVGGTITNAVSGRFLVPAPFIGGTIVTGYGVWINGAGAGTTRWGLYQDNATPNNALFGKTSIGHLTAPAASMNLDVASQIKIRSVAAVCIFNFSGATGTIHSRIFTGDGNPGSINLDSFGNTNNNSLRFDMETNANAVTLTSPSGDNLQLNFPKVFIGTEVPNNTTSNRFIKLVPPSGRVPDVGIGSNYFDVEYAPAGVLNLGSGTYANIAAIKLQGPTVTHTAAAVSGNYSTLQINGEPTGGPTPSGDRLAIWVISGKTRLDSTLETRGQRIKTITSRTGTATIANSAYFNECNAASFNLTLPSSPDTGQSHCIKNIHATGVVTLVGTIDGTVNPTLLQYESIKIYYNGSAWYTEEF